MHFLLKLEVKDESHYLLINVSNPSSTSPLVIDHLIPAYAWLYVIKLHTTKSSLHDSSSRTNEINSNR
jgi:hypothetical protein